MAKQEKKKYMWFPVIQNEHQCPLCGFPLVQSKLNLILYDGLNQNSIEQIHKIPFCSRCHIPFLTKTEVQNIQHVHPGFHIEHENLTTYMSKTFLTRKIATPPLPIKNVPKNTLLFVGETHHHKCGTESLKTYTGLLHGDTNIPVQITECKMCNRNIISPNAYKKIKKRCTDYIFAKDKVAWKDIFPDKQKLYLLNINQYTKDNCPSCRNKLTNSRLEFKCDESTMLISKSVKICSKCGMTFGRITSFKDKYNQYKLSYDFYQEESFRTNEKQVIIKTGDFLTRHNLSGCIQNNHSIEDITARIRIVNRLGEESDYDIPAVRCDTCGKLFLLETEYQKIMSMGIPLCSIVENEYWRTNHSQKHKWSESDAKGSVMYTHGYNVAMANDLTIQQRHAILRTLIKDTIITKAEICSHLDTLIKRAETQPLLKNAKAKWEIDRAYIETYDTSDETVRVKSITHKSYKTKSN